MTWLNKEHLPGIVAASVLVGCFTMLILILFVPLTADKQVAGSIVGAVISALTTLVNYFFGSSAGSARKNDMIMKQMTTEQNKNGMDSY